MSKSKILFQMTGSIACFKACQVISKLVQNGYDVQVVMTASALQFVGAPTIEGLTGKPVISDLFSSGNVMDHIHLVRWSDLILVAPATANYVNKVSQGIGDDLATTMFLAHDFKKPFLIAPAMNTSMYLHPVTQKSIQNLRSMGIEILETASGVLACGEVGWGRLLEPDLIVDEVKKHLATPKKNPVQISVEKSVAPKILITSGGTTEAIDQVRSLTNNSTGATGSFLADNLSQLGFDVVYLHAENAKMPQYSYENVSFKSFKDLQGKLSHLIAGQEFAVVIHAAAVSDFSLAESFNGKISSKEDLTLKLKRNPKLVNEIKQQSKNKDLKLIAFKMTAQAGLGDQQQAVAKLFTDSNADMIVHNDVTDMDLRTNQHFYHLYSDSKNLDQVQTCHNKSELAQALGVYLSSILPGRSK